jgi:hypothetical protein
MHDKTSASNLLIVQVIRTLLYGEKCGLLASSLTVVLASHTLSLCGSNCGVKLLSVAALRQASKVASLACPSS